MRRDDLHKFSRLDSRTLESLLVEQLNLPRKKNRHFLLLSSDECNRVKYYEAWRSFLRLELIELKMNYDLNDKAWKATKKNDQES